MDRKQTLSISIKYFFLCLYALMLNQSALLAVPSPQNYQEKIKEATKKQLERTKNYKVLKDSVQFPNMPVYNRSTKFITGYLEPNQNGVSTCEMQFYAQEDPQTIVSFYKDALSANNWKIWYANVNTISARHKSGDMFNINVHESKVPKTKSTIVIDYRQIDQPH